jgi:transposase
MEKSVCYVGLDVHKKLVVYCSKTADGTVVEEGEIAATRRELRRWAEGLSWPWTGGMEATMFTGWIYDVLKPYAVELKVANPQMLRAIVASKRKNDRVDAAKIADALRCDLLPECYMAPQAMRDLRRVLRFRNFVVHLATALKNKTAGLLMECGAEYDKERLHRRHYFQELLGELTETPESVKDLLRFNRGILDVFEQTQRRLLRGLREHPMVATRVERLKTIGGVGDVVALTWALEVVEPKRFGAIRQAVSYCGLCSGERESAGKRMRGPLSKQRNEHLQWVLVEAAKLAVLWNPQLAAVHQKELQRGNRNRATLAVARKLVAYLLAVDKSGKNFEPREVRLLETEKTS